MQQDRDEAEQQHPPIGPGQEKAALRLVHRDDQVGDEIMGHREGEPHGERGEDDGEPARQIEPDRRLGEAAACPTGSALPGRVRDVGVHRSALKDRITQSSYTLTGIWHAVDFDAVVVAGGRALRGIRRVFGSFPCSTTSVDMCLVAGGSTAPLLEAFHGVGREPPSRVRCLLPPRLHDAHRFARYRAAGLRVTPGQAQIGPAPDLRHWAPGRARGEQRDAGVVEPARSRTSARRGTLARNPGR